MPLICPNYFTLYVLYQQTHPIYYTLTLQLDV